MRIATGLLFVFLITACIAQPEIAPTDTPVPSPTSPPTATPVWFPPTQTPTPAPVIDITPIPEVIIPRGRVLLHDDFNDPAPWQTFSTTSGTVALGSGEINLSLQVPDSFLSTFRDQPVFDNFVLEIIASPNLCQGEDEYGILFRASPPSTYYRFSVSCDGKTRLDRIANGGASSPQPWMESAVIPSGAPSSSVLVIRAVGEEMAFYINNQLHFSISDPILTSGQIGLFIRSTGNNLVSVSFSELVLYGSE